MKKLIRLFFVLLFSAVTLASVQAREKVILDTDMVEVFDDGMAMMMLQRSPAIELLGVTVVVGNSRVGAGLAYALKQLESIDARNIPVFAGVTLPIRPNRLENIKEENKLFGRGHDGWLGAAQTEEPASWEAFYTSRYGSSPTLRPQTTHAVDFIIEQVKKYPHQITIAAIGTCVNLAMAVRKAPEIIPLIKRVVYMGGAFFQQGNVTPAAEFNWWLDPEAAKVAVRSPFKEQIVVGLDVCEKVRISAEQYKTVMNTVKSKDIKTMLEQSYMFALFEKDSSYKHYIWDVLVAALIIDPSTITGEKTYHIDVNTEFGSSYGQALAYKGPPPAGTQPARIITDMDGGKVWSLILELAKKI